MDRANDFAQGITAKITVVAIESGIVELWKAGARNFVVINLHNIALTPTVKAQGTQTAAQQFVYTVNAALQPQLPYYALADSLSIRTIVTRTQTTTFFGTDSIRPHWCITSLGIIQYRRISPPDPQVFTGL